MQDLPTLSGTPKQVAWAADIRPRVLHLLDEAAAKVRGAAAEWVKEGEQPAAIVPEIDAALDVLLTEMRDDARAKFWIEVDANRLHLLLGGMILDRGMAPSYIDA